MVAAKKSSGAKVPPNAVRVWRGFRLGGPAEDYLTALGSIFIPATAQLQSLYGLTAYLPTVLPLQKPTGVPDEIALVFYRTQQAYDDTKLTVAGRAYSSLHSTVFAFPQSESGFPVLLDDSVKFDTPYFLFADEADWMTGFTQVFVGTRRADTTAQSFASGLLDYAQGLQLGRPKGLEGAVLHATEEWVLYWEHWTNESASRRGKFSTLAKLADRVLSQPYTATPLAMDLTAHYPGVTVKGGESFNIRFPRRGAAARRRS